MKITKFVEFSQEVEISIGLHEIVDAYLECPNDVRLESALSAIGQIPKLFDPIPDSTIAQMSAGQHTTIRNYLLKVVARFNKTEERAADNAEAGEQPLTA